MSLMENGATLLLITTQSSLRLRKQSRIRPTCTQTETSSLSALRAEILHCAEILFQPSPTAKEASGFHDTSFQSVTKCNIYTRTELCTNAVFYDDTAMFQRIVDRMTKELTDTIRDASLSLRPVI